MLAIDLYTKAVLTIIALALLHLAVRPLLEPRPAMAAAERPCGHRATEPCFIATPPFGAPLRVEVVRAAR